MQENIKICYALWDTVKKCQNAKMRDLIQDMNFAYDSIMLPVVDSDLMTMIRWAADETDYTHIVIYDSGTCLNNPDTMKAAWHAHCSTTWLVTGHIMLRDSDQYPYFHKQALAINLDIWKACGRPYIGYDDANAVNLPLFERSYENVHDDYTPIWLRPSKAGTIVVANKRFGWNIIAASLTHGYKVPNLPIAVRKTKIYIYPDDKPDALIDAVAVIRNGETYDVNSISNETQQKYLHKLIWTLNSDKNSAIYLFNTGDVLINKILMNGEMPDAIWTTASGFKSFAEWYFRGADTNCQINTFDFNQNSLDVWKQIHAHWSGRNFYEFMQSIDEKCDDDTVYCWGNRRDAEKVQQCSDRQEHELMQLFGSADAMQSAWQIFKKLDHRYHLCNLVDDPDKLIAAIDPSRQHIIWLNNIFYFNRSIMKYGIEKMRTSLLKLARALNDASPNSMMHGQCAHMYFEDVPLTVIEELSKGESPKYQCQLNEDSGGIRKWAGHPLIL
jgi:hypothetical protein